MPTLEMTHGPCDENKTHHGPGPNKKQRFQGRRAFSIRVMYSHLPIGSMYGIFSYIWLIFMVNVGKYTIHGSYGLEKNLKPYIYIYILYPYSVCIFRVNKK